MSWIIVYLVMLLMNFTTQDCSGRSDISKNIGVLIFYDSEGSSVVTQVKDYINTIGIDFIVQFVASENIQERKVNCNDTDVIVVLGDTLCRNYVALMSLHCDRPHLCFSAKDIQTIPSKVINANTFTHHYPSVSSTRVFLQQQVSIQKWDTREIHLILASDEYNVLAKDVIDVLDYNEILIRQYQVSSDKNIQTVLDRVFQVSELTQHREDPTIVFIGEIDTFITVLQKLNASVHEKLITRYFESQWLVFTKANVSSAIGQLNMLVSDINMDAVGILELQYPTIEPSTNPVMDFVVALQEYVTNRTSWELVAGTWCPACICASNTSTINMNVSERASFSVTVLNNIIRDLPQSLMCKPYNLYVIRFVSGKQSFHLQNPCAKNNSKTWLKMDAFPAQKLGLNGRHFRIVTLESPPFVSIDSKTLKYEGICIDMLEELSNDMNFTFTLSRSPDGEFGIKRVNNTWSGMIGAILKNETDLAFASLTVSPSRKMVVDFVEYYLEFGAILIKVPQKEDTAYRVIAQPFHWTVWLPLFISVPVAGLITWWLSNMLTQGLHKKPEPFDNYMDAQWYVVGALLTQGGEAPTHFPTRSFIGCWWYFTVVTVAAYGGSLYMFLTLNMNTVPFTTGEEMVQSGYTWGTTGGSFYVSELQNASEGLLREMWAGIYSNSLHDPEILSTSKAVHFDKVRDGGYALISDRTALDLQAAADTSCELAVLKYRFLPMPLGIALKKFSPYKSVLQKSVTKLRSIGFLKVWQNKWWPKGACSGVFLADPGAIRLMDMQSSFYMLMIGIIAAFVSLVGENFLKRSSFLKTLLPW